MLIFGEVRDFSEGCRSLEQGSNKVGDKPRIEHRNKPNPHARAEEKMTSYSTEKGSEERGGENLWEGREAKGG